MHESAEQWNAQHPKGNVVSVSLRRRGEASQADYMTKPKTIIEAVAIRAANIDR
jgi:hypothetical protein